MKPELRAALFFLPEDAVAVIRPLGAGNINDTYTVTLRSGEHRILQRLNPAVFPDPQAVMRNMRVVLDHLRREGKNMAAGGNTFSFPILYPGSTGDWYTAADGSLWRMMSMVEDSVPCSRVTDPGQARELGRGLGYFHRLLRNLDPGILSDTLPDIHNTAKYLHTFDTVLSRLSPHGSPEDDFCSAFIARYRNRIPLPAADMPGLAAGVIHGDPKVDNFLFDTKQQRVLSLIDLDTVKPGPLLHDLGDALRSCCNTGGESPVPGERTVFDQELFQAWISGYCSQALFLLHSRDLDRIVDSVLGIAFELGVRFYTDYLDGDSYFKVLFPGQNLQRALIQFYLAESIEKQRDDLQALVNKAAGTF